MTDQAAMQQKIEELRSTLEKDPKSTSFVALVDAYRQSGQMDDALEVALRGTWELPQYPEGYVAVGRVYAQRKVFRKAEEFFYKALSVDQMSISAYKGLARIYREQGDLQKTSDILTKAIMLDPSDQSLQRMIESLSDSGDSTPVNAPQPAATEPREDIMDQQSAGMKPITTATIADIYVEQGLYDKALEVYRELLAEKPDDPSVQQKISELESLMNSSVAESNATAASSAETGSMPDHQTEQATAAPNVEGSEETTHSDPDDLIDKLSAWLESIQARRSRV